MISPKRKNQRLVAMGRETRPLPSPVAIPMHPGAGPLASGAKAWFLRVVEILDQDEWKARRTRHENRVEPWIRPRLQRMSRGLRHPVEDFLFEYYPYRPAQLKRWHPGYGSTLLGPEAREFLAVPGHVETPDGITAGPLPEKRRAFVKWLGDFLGGIESRAPFFGCHGLHEWAMVYRTPEIRHESLPLRLSPGEIAGVVETLPVRCSHYDAFRFFTEAARPLNLLQPTRDKSPRLEQPACLHANMDLYKWSFKLAPWTPSDLVADAFELAREIRELDMRASPYDLSDLGLAAVRIEIPEGRSDYEKAQRGFAERARPIRRRLRALCGDLLENAG